VRASSTAFVADNGICEPSDLDWLTRNALGFRVGLLDLAHDLGAEEAHRICTSYAAAHPGFEVPASLREKRPTRFLRDVKVERDGELAVVTLRRPEARNALSERTMRELGEAFATLEKDPSVRGVVLTSFDGAIAGADITELAVLKDALDCQRSSSTGQKVLDRIAAFPRPVVAALDGPVLGGGAELSMACHARVVGPQLVLGQPEVNLGIIPGYGGTQRLPRLVGLERGAEMVRTARTATAAEACAWGWASGAPAADVVGAAKALLRRHLAGEVKLAPVDPAPMKVPAAFPPADLGYRSLAIDAIVVEVMREGLALPLAEGLAVESRGFGRCKGTVDMDIGMKNFIQNGPRVPAVFLNE
jgi:enoyl-CoA hydratase/carnithine racemase